MTRTVVSNTHHQAIANNIKAGENFRNGTNSFSGHTVPKSHAHMFYAGHGIMPYVEASVMESNMAERGIDYIIRSYSTPIAYRLLDGTWIVPTASYSVTTGRHQSHVWSILRKLGIDVSWHWVPDTLKSGKPSKSRSHRVTTAFWPIGDSRKPEHKRPEHASPCTHCWDELELVKFDS